MWIMPSPLPRIKTFLKPAGLGEHATGMVVRLMSAFLLHAGRMSASAAAGSIRSEGRHRAAVKRFLTKSELANTSVAYLAVAESVLRLERQRRGKWIFIVDKTSVTHQGDKTPNTYSTGNRQRRPRKGRRYNQRKTASRRCQGFAAGLLITPSGFRLPIHHCYYTKAYAQQTARQHLTEAELAAWLIRRLPAPPGVDLVVLGDTAYEAQCVRQACAERGFHWIVPANPERVLEGPKPRPKLGTRVQQFSSEQWTRLRLQASTGEFAAGRRLSRHRLGPKLKARTYYVHQERLTLHSVGEVRVVFSTKEEPRAGRWLTRENLKVLLTNDLRLSVRQIVELYELRWQIELFFKELKSTFGMHQYRFRDFAAVETWMEVCCLAFLYLEWLRAQRLQRRDCGPDQRRRWEPLRTYGLCLAVRQLAQAAELQFLAAATSTKTGLKKLKRLLRHALPLEYRIAT